MPSTSSGLIIPPGVNHPEHRNWCEEAYADVPTEALAGLENRYSHLGETALSGLKLQLEVATAQDSASRQHEERVNSGYLVPEYATPQEYADLAIDPSRIVEYLAWFKEVAGRALNSGAPEAPKKVGLELFGSVRQWGNWGSATQLDALIDELLQKIDRSETDMSSWKFDKNSLPDNKPIKYRFRPNYLFHSEADEQAMSAFQYGTVERWRPVADIFFGEDFGTTTHIFKRSRAIIVLGQLASSEERAALSIDSRLSHEERLKALTEATRVAGTIFERAISAPDGSTLDMLPIGVHYVQMLRRNEGIPVEDE